jgi:signal transduction histidine kinase
MQGGLASRQTGAWALDSAGAMTDNSIASSVGRSVALEARHDETLQECLDRLRRDVAELRASRQRIVLASDADRRAIERDLHEGVQQHLVALSVQLQIARQRVEAEPSEARALLEELERSVQEAVDEAARLAEWIHPPLPEAGGLAAALRTAVVNRGIRASVDVDAGVAYSPEIARTVYLCCIAGLEHVRGDAALTVRVAGRAVEFDVSDASSRSGEPRKEEVERLRDRVEALGGQLTVGVHPGGGIWVSGSLPTPS